MKRIYIILIFLLVLFNYAIAENEFFQVNAKGIKFIGIFEVDDNIKVALYATDENLFYSSDEKLYNIFLKLIEAEKALYYLKTNKEFTRKILKEAGVKENIINEIFETNYVGVIDTANKKLYYLENTQYEKYEKNIITAEELINDIRVISINKDYLVKVRFSYVKIYDIHKFYNRNWGLEVSTTAYSNRWIKGKTQLSTFLLKKNENYTYQYQYGGQTLTDTTICHKTLIIPSIKFGAQIQNLHYSLFYFYPYITIGWYPINVNFSYDETPNGCYLEENNWWILDSWDFSFGADFDIMLSESTGINIGYENMINLSNLHEKKGYDIPLKNLHYHSIKFSLIISY